jgi:hypothetical protein
MVVIQAMWFRGCAYVQHEGAYEAHGIAVYATQEDAQQREEQPMFIMPTDITSAADIVRSWDVIRCGIGVNFVNCVVKD